ncbi:MAG: hypothetical protein JWO03_3942 [Bacteroidetes bacterium]|nr:hypothetical protein [Bacteroidota bacterium]
MMIKSIGAKGGGSFSYLLDYVNRDAALRDKNNDIISIKHNVFGSPEEILEQFKANEAGRVHKRGDGNNNMLLHMIFSLSNKDEVTSDMLIRLSREYMKMYPDALHYGVLHMSEPGKHPHSHVLTSGVDMMGYSTRQSKQDFKNMKQELERISRELYPELVYSNIEHGKDERSISENEWQMTNAGKVSRKSEIEQIVADSMELATSRDTFFGLLRGEGLETYERSGKVAGIRDNRNYRFATLGADLAELDQREQRLNEIVNEPNIEQELTQTLDDNVTEEQERLNELEEYDRGIDETIL